MSSSPSLENEKAKHCEHYPYIHANIITTGCCQGIYNCKKCHDETQDHKFGNVTQMQCQFCNETVPFAQTCSHCHAQVCDYICVECTILSDVSTCFHCDKCAMCWNFPMTFPDSVVHREKFHCDRCQICAWKDSHICHPENENGQCCICHQHWKAENIFKNPIVHGYLCGHFMHLNCFNDNNPLSPFHHHEKNFFDQCPCCFKSMMKYDYVELNEYFDQVVKHVIDDGIIDPLDMENGQVDIICNDCGKQSFQVPYRFLYHACQHCQSCNTVIEKYSESISLDLQNISDQIS